MSDSLLQDGYDLAKGHAQTAYHVLKKFNKTRTFSSKFVTEASARMIENRIASVEIICPPGKRCDQSLTSILSTRGRWQAIN